MRYHRALWPGSTPTITPSLSQWSMVLAYAMFGIWSAGMAYIKYKVGFM